MSGPSARARAAQAMLVAAGAFVVLFVLAVLEYPGGTDWDPRARGHHFWLNYLCDLTRSVALDGEPNPVGSVLAQAGTVSCRCGGSSRSSSLRAGVSATRFAALDPSA